jgi:hypothetical protein
MNNIECTLKHIQKTLGDEIFMWLNTPYGKTTYGSSKYSDLQIRSFIQSIFYMLELGHVCFSSGTLVFNDNCKLLFNLLTYDKFLIEESNLYNCNNPLNSIQNRRKPRISDKNVHFQTSHKTHNKVFEQEKGRPIECIPSPNSYTKFERVLNPPLRQLCGENSESKSVLLYYPFISTNNDRNLLFFKLERDKMVSYGHFSKATATYIGNPLDRLFGTKIGVNERPLMGVDAVTQLDLRREDRNPERHPNECNYNQYFEYKDLNFYYNYYQILGIPYNFMEENIEEDIEELTWYNTNVRTGCEFYVTKNLLVNMFLHLFVPINALILNNIDIPQIPTGGRKPIKNKKNKKKSRKYKNNKYTHTHRRNKR